MHVAVLTNTDCQTSCLFYDSTQQFYWNQSWFYHTWHIVTDTNISSQMNKRLVNYKDMRHSFPTNELKCTLSIFEFAECYITDICCSQTNLSFAFINFVKVHWQGSLSLSSWIEHQNTTPPQNRDSPNLIPPLFIFHFNHLLPAPSLPISCAALFHSRFGTCSICDAWKQAGNGRRAGQDVQTMTRWLLQRLRKKSGVLH